LIFSSLSVTVFFYKDNVEGNDMVKSTMHRKTAFITGASSGIGWETAVYLVKKEWRVFATARKDKDLQRLQDIGVNALRCELSSSESIQECCKELNLQTDRIDLLVNNAAYGQMGGLLDLSFASIQQQFLVNVVGTMELTRLCFPLLNNSILPRVIFVSSILGVISAPFLAPYCASKHALESLIQSLRMEFKAVGVKIKLTSIRPGPVVTAFKDNASKQFYSKINIEKSINSGIYKNYLKRESETKQSIGVNANQVARLIERIARSKFPRRVYYVHWVAHVSGRLFRFLPMSLQERLVMLSV
jgi:short-subunit dehydrogenase